MKIRNDSPFHGISEAQIDEMMAIAETDGFEEVARWWEELSGKDVRGGWGGRGAIVGRGDGVAE